MLFYHFSMETDEETGNQVYKGLWADIYIGSPALNMSRIVCSFLLHISVIPEIQSAKEMMSFAKKNLTRFSGQRFEYPMLFALFKFFGGVASFAANIFLCLYSETIDDVVKDFVAVMIIN